MLTAFATVVLTLSPLIVVVALLELARWRERLVEDAVTCQITLTDAIAAEMGAIVAPVVTPTAWGPWRVRMAVPLGRPATTGRVLTVAHRVLDRVRPSGYELVLTPQAEPARAARSLSIATPRVKIA